MDRHNLGHPNTHLVTHILAFGVHYTTRKKDFQVALSRRLGFTLYKNVKLCDYLCSAKDSKSVCEIIRRHTLWPSPPKDNIFIVCSILNKDIMPFQTLSDVLTFINNI